jgi:hypothetical protein
MFKVLMFITTVLTSLGLYLSAANAETCSRMCDPARSRPCGKSCIPKDNNCTMSWTTACVGTKENRPSINFENPKHLDKAPTSSQAQ